MKRSLSLALAISVALSLRVFAQDALPEKDEFQGFGIEPPLLIPNREQEDERDAEIAAAAAANVSPSPSSLQRLEKQLEQARRSVGGADRLYKIGVLAKVEVEQRTLRMIRLQAEVENTRLALARENLVVQQKSVSDGQFSKEVLQQAEDAVAIATIAAAAAAKKRDEAELAAAELNLQRQRLLFTLGSGRKSDVAKAEQKLADLKASKQ